MQVASIFRETAKLLGASMDGNPMENNGKYCLKSGGQPDDGYETCVDPQVSGLCNPNHVERMMAPGMDHGGMRHLQMDHQNHMNHHHHHHHSHQQPPLPPLPQHHQHHSLPPGHPGLRPGHMPGMKLEQYSGDPYSFVEESNSNNMCIPNNNNNNNMNMNNTHNNNMPPQAKKRGRKKKPDLATMNQMDSYGNGPAGKQGNGRNGGGGDREFHPPDVKERKRHDRFNGVSEEEVSKRTVPDHLAPNLDVVIVGINPGLFAAYKGHHYAGPGNHFWKCLYLSGLVPEPFTAEDDSTLLRQGIGFTNMVSRPTKGSADLTRREIKQGSRILQEKLQKYQPKVAVFNGKLIYEVFSGKKDFPFGRQPEFVEGTNTYIWVMPSSSARCAQLPRAADKVPFYAALKKFRDYLNGLITEIDDSEIVFPDSKPLPKSLTAPLEQKKSTESNHCSGPDEGGQPGFPSETPNKKKRGRPRKGMEKHPPGPKKEKLPKLEGDMKKSCGSGGGNNMHYDNGSKRTGAEPPERKRRGRPKKAKVESNSSPSFSVRSSGTPDIMMDSGNHHMPVTCPPPTASSVSSGYSTATSTTEERTRRSEENSSISNTGSGGPSPSHHSYTTQSDLSSEISAAISCGSPPQSPSNNHSDNIFDGLSGMVNHRDDRSNQQQQQQQQQQHYTKMENHQNAKGHSQQQQHHMSEVPCNSNENNDGMYMSSSMDHQQQDGPPAFSPYHHHPGLDSRSMSRNVHYPAPMSRGSSNSTNTPTSSSSGAYHGHGSFEPPAAPPPARTSFDVASKSLSGLESLVDQIPSISEAEAGMGHPPPGLPAGLLPESIPHSASGSSSSASIANPLAHSHYSDSPSAGFLPYGTPTSSYANPSHYGSPSYYPSDLSSSFPVNSLATPSAPYQPSSFFGYPGYHAGQYGSSHSSSSYSHASAAAAAAASLHLHSSSPYGSALGYPSPYSNPSAYMHQSSLAPGPPSSANSRYPQRLHLRQDGMDIGSMGFGGF